MKALGKHTMPFWVLVLVLPVVHAQAPAEGFVSITDPEGDVAVEPFGEAPAPSQDELAGLDILTLSIGPDTPTALPIQVQMKSLEDPSDGLGFGDISISVGFQFGEAKYVIQEHAYCPGETGLISTPEASTPRLMGCLSLSVDIESAILQYDLEKRFLHALSGRPFAPGDEIDGLHANSYASYGGIPTAVTEQVGQPPFRSYAYDRAPDEGGLDFQALSGGSASGSPGFQMVGPDPLRATNGGEVTFRYVVQLQETSGESRSLSLEALDVWEGAHVFLPAETTLAPNANQSIDVYLSLDSGHLHGESKWFQVQATDKETNEWSSIELGVNWLDIPQPAGHHPTVWLHSSSHAMDPIQDGVLETSLQLIEQPSAWMNVVVEDPSPSSTGDPVEAALVEVAVDYENRQVADYEWIIPQSPQLQVGLQLLPESLGKISLRFDQLDSAQEFAFQALLGVCQGLAQGSSPGPEVCRGGWISIAEAEAEALAPQSGSVEVEGMDLDISQDHLHIPYHQDNNLVLWIKATLANGGAPIGDLRPTLIVTESSMELPLAEYTDPSPLTGEPSEALPEEVKTAPVEPPAKKSPSMGIMALGLSLLVLGLARRPRKRPGKGW
jgi:hypothetical protein